MYNIEYHFIIFIIFVILKIINGYHNCMSYLDEYKNKTITAALMRVGNMRMCMDALDDVESSAVVRYDIEMTSDA